MVQGPPGASFQTCHPLPHFVSLKEKRQEEKVIPAPVSRLDLLFPSFS